ncbi:hypothetical protein PYW07_005072 [Mythimna separata]|uniref:Uncharacterized protein n=1 Tax=Mythimna separata TaxID=271217 RepID=A0AAD7YDT3_MYTSE|nr:hypothetical protein PYW07_005072 [Mythimna separata]
MAGHESDRCLSRPGFVELPTYSVYLMAFTIFFMSLAIIGLSGALYFAKKKKTILEINNDSPKQFTSYDEPNKNNGSTLTVNSGIIQISEPRQSDPITPTRIEESKIVFAKKPLKPIGPIVDRGQMDAICKEVLKKVAKSDSACYRDLNELLKFENKEDNSSIKEENKNEDKPEFGTPTLFKLKKPENKKEKKETETETKLEIKDESKQETKNETTKETETQTKLDENKDVRIEINDVEKEKNEEDSDSETEYDTVPSPIRFRHSGPEPEQAMYDTVPNPTRFRHSDPEPDQGMYDTVASPKRFRNSGDTDNDLDDIPFYDLPPLRNQDGPSKNVIQRDSETHYLMPISADKTESCYINAKRQSFTAPKS